MTRQDDEFPPLDVTSTLNLGALDEVLEALRIPVVEKPGYEADDVIACFAKRPLWRTAD